MVNVFFFCFSCDVSQLNVFFFWPWEMLFYRMNIVTSENSRVVCFAFSKTFSSWFFF